MSVSKAQRRANEKYDKENMASIGLKIPKQERLLYESEAEKQKKTLSRYIRDCVKYCIEHDIKLQ